MQNFCFGSLNSVSIFVNCFLKDFAFAYWGAGRSAGASRGTEPTASDVGSISKSGVNPALTYCPAPSCQVLTLSSALGT